MKMVWTMMNKSLLGNHRNMSSIDEEQKTGIKGENCGAGLGDEKQH